MSLERKAAIIKVIAAFFYKEEILLAVEYTPNKNPYIFVGVTSCILAIGLYAIDRFFKRTTSE